MSVHCSTVPLFGAKAATCVTCIFSADLFSQAHTQKDDAFRCAVGAVFAGKEASYKV